MARPKIKFVPESLHVKTGDIVYVISGKDKKKTGKVLRVFPKKRKNNRRRYKYSNKTFKAISSEPTRWSCTKRSCNLLIKSYAV